MDHSISPARKALSGVALALAAVLSACGGELTAPENTGEDEFPPAGATDESSAPVVVAPTLDQLETDSLTLINNYRAQNGKPALVPSVALTNAAQAHSQDEADHDYFSHTGTDGTHSWDRIYRAGYPRNSATAEDIAWLNYPDELEAAAVLAAYQGSPDHNAALLGNYTYIGIARVVQISTGKSYWTHDLALTGNDVQNASFGSSISGAVAPDSVRTVDRWYPNDTRYSYRSCTSTNCFLRNKNILGAAAIGTQVLKAKPGLNYRASARAKYTSGTGGDQQFLIMDFLNASYASLGSLSVGTGTSTSWHRVSVPATGTASPAGTAYVRIKLYGSAGDGQIDWDDVQLEAW